jgi:heme oxygenase
MTLTELLKRETSELHAAIEATLLAKRIASSEIKRAEYINLLRRLLKIHKAFEIHIGDLPNLSSIWNSYMVRSEDIICDLINLGASPTALPISIADSWIEAIFKSTWSPLGAIYVFEGSRLGSYFLADRLAKALQVPVQLGCGLDYHLRNREQRFILWNRFRDIANSMLLSEEAQNEVVRGAQQTFVMLMSVYGDEVHDLCVENGDEFIELASKGIAS